MNTEREHQKTLITRRALLEGGGLLAGSAVFAHIFSSPLTAGANGLFARRGALSARAAAALAGYAQQGAGAAPANQLAAMRAQMGATPITSTKLAENLTLLAGPGGNVVVLHGPDGKIVVDSFVQPAWPKLKENLDAMGNQPIKLLIDTHWHFDHTDNNARFHDAGADKLLKMADNNTKIVPGHGPLGDRAALTKYRDMLIAARERVQKLKSSGKSEQEIVAAKPFADLEPAWGKGLFNGDAFVGIVYSTL